MAMMIVDDPQGDALPLWLLVLEEPSLLLRLLSGTSLQSTQRQRIAGAASLRLRDKLRRAAFGGSPSRRVFSGPISQYVAQLAAAEAMMPALEAELRDKYPGAEIAR